MSNQKTGTFFSCIEQVMSPSFRGSLHGRIREDLCAFACLCDARRQVANAFRSSLSIHEGKRSGLVFVDLAAPPVSFPLHPSWRKTSKPMNVARAYSSGPATYPVQPQAESGLRCTIGALFCLLLPPAWRFARRDRNR